MDRYPDLQFATTLDPPLAVTVDRPRARFSAWYEMFPRSTSSVAGRHGTFADCEARLPYVAEMGFDVLYFPPIHPIGAAFRKGKNNAPSRAGRRCRQPVGDRRRDGGAQGSASRAGHAGRFSRLVAAAADHGIEIALDIAYQCSPDHPYVKEHPEWFRTRPDGTIQYAENPPKKYQDIYPFDFETADWRALWDELKSVVLFWVEQGVRIFRVDNPHTKPFAFWEWMIDDIKRQHPDVLFLSEAFTRPKVMYRLAKLGFTQSYTYFTWRNTKQELTEYLAGDHAAGDARFLPPEPVDQHARYPVASICKAASGRPFIARLVLAATLGANYGMYGPPFELGISTPREPHSEEYLNSEKYEITHWQLDRPESLRGTIAAVNRARRANRALQSDANLEFHPIETTSSSATANGPTTMRTSSWSSSISIPYHTHSGNVGAAARPLGHPRRQAVSNGRPADRQPLRLARSPRLDRPAAAADARPRFSPASLGRHGRQRRCF